MWCRDVDDMTPPLAWPVEETKMIDKRNFIGMAATMRELCAAKGVQQDSTDAVQILWALNILEGKDPSDGEDELRALLSADNEKDSG